jgi:uncharacterized Zn finger protein (UPF0148 family)
MSVYNSGRATGRIDLAEGKGMTTIQCTKCKTTLTPQQAGEPCPICGSMDRNLTAEDRAVARDKALMARELARKHYEVEPGLTRVIRCSGAAEVEFKPAELLEVNTNTVASGVLPLGFDPLPSAGIKFPSIIVEVTPAEYERILAKDLSLPPGWLVEDELAKPQEAAGA